MFTANAVLHMVHVHHTADANQIIHKIFVIHNTAFYKLHVWVRLSLPLVVCIAGFSAYFAAAIEKRNYRIADTNNDYHMLWGSNKWGIKLKHLYMRTSLQVNTKIFIQLLINIILNQYHKVSTLTESISSSSCNCLSTCSENGPTWFLWTRSEQYIDWDICKFDNECTCEIE